MSNRSPLPFKKTDVHRAIKIARDAGLPIARLEFGDRGFSLVVGQSGVESSTANEWDDEPCPPSN